MAGRYGETVALVDDPTEYECENINAVCGRLKRKTETYLFVESLYRNATQSELNNLNEYVNIYNASANSLISAQMMVNYSPLYVKRSYSTYPSTASYTAMVKAHEEKKLDAWEKYVSTLENLDGNVESKLGKEMLTKNCKSIKDSIIEAQKKASDTNKAKQTQIGMSDMVLGGIKEVNQARANFDAWLNNQ